MVRCGVRARGPVLAGFVAGWLVGATPARADDLRDQFGLGKGPPQPALPSCDDGLAFNCALPSDPLDQTAPRSGGADGRGRAPAVDAATPYALSTWLPGSYLRRLPVGAATHEAVASYALGAGHDEVGPIFGGATGLESRWTIDGAPADNLQTGAAETRVPLGFLDGMLVTAGGFSARDRASTGGTIDARLKRGTAAHELAAEAWTSWSRDGRQPPVASGTYAVRRETSNPGPSVTASLVATGPLGDLGGGHAWYAAGIAPTLASTERSWRTLRLIDDDGNGVPDGLPGDAAVVSFENTSDRTLDPDVPIMARAGLDRGVHHVELSLIGDVARDSRFLALSTLQAAGVDRRTTVGDLSATWHAAWADTGARVQLAWHHSARTESAHDAAGARLPQLRSAYVPATLADDPALAAACADGTPQDLAPRIANCPVQAFASGGAGLLTDVVGDRPSLTGDVTQRLGGHVVRAGATLEDSRLVSTARFTGGALDSAPSPGELSRRQFYRGACSADPAEPCAYAPSSALTYRTTYAAAYVEDTVAPSPGLAIDAGLRWELMWLGDQLRSSHQLAPRVGVTWDPLGGGRTRLWASYGRTFAMLPAGLGATVIRRDATVDDRVGAAGASRSLDPGAAFPVAAEVQPIHQDEVAIGAEVALVGALRATVWGQGRRLRDGLETTHGSFGNPGGNGDPGATRETELVAASLEMAQQDKLTIRAGVLWGRTVGTWVGPYDPGIGAAPGQTLLQGPAWDASAVNLDGALPTDAGGQAFFEAERRATLGAVGLAVATRLAVASGRPRNALGNSPGGLIELLPRGALGCGPVISQADVRLAARWRGTTVTLDVLNVFDRREVTRVDELYSDDLVQPIAGGKPADLASLKTTTGQDAVRRAAFQLPIAFQAPLSVTLGVHRAF
jgi:TonB dependent receptor